MDNIKEFKVNGTAYGLNLSEIGAVINDGGTQKELKQYIDSHSGGGGGGGGTSSKVVIINPHWYDNTGNYQSEIKKAFEDIYNEVSNNHTVTVITTGYYSSSEYVYETTNVMTLGKNDILVVFMTEWGNKTFNVWFHYDEGSNYYGFSLSENNLATKSSLYLPYVYTDGQINIDTNNGNISEFISEANINDTNKFVILKTTVPGYDVTAEYNNIYYAFIDRNGNNYKLSKFAGIKINNNNYDENFDLIPDGEWYIIYCEIQDGKTPKCIISKSVRNDDGTLDVYLGIKGYTIGNFRFYDCTVENRDMQGEPGLWSEKGWTMVSDAPSSGTISIDSFIGKRTRVSFKNKSNPSRKYLTLFKRMK